MAGAHQQSLLALALVLSVACGAGGDDVSFVAVTFNTGTAPELGHDAVPPDDGYTEADAEIADMFYGNGLSWPPAIDAARIAIETANADIVAFQEIFHPEECANIPTGSHEGFVCETWRAGDLTVAQTVVGTGYQVACHLDKPDKCLAVRRSFATIRGCAGELCLDGLAGARVEDCGGGSRVGRATLDLEAGGTLTVVSVHGSSGLASSDQDCRVKQFDQVFVDLDGEPAANGETNLILGDLNTDPGRLATNDSSAARMLDFVDDGKPFRFISESGPEAPATYLGLLNIDHVVSDTLDGSCQAAGISDGVPAVIDAIYFDHTPIICAVRGLD